MSTGAPVTIYSAQDPTASYTASSSVDMNLHSYCDLVFIATATTPTSYEVIIQTSQDGTNWEPLALVLEISGGAMPLRGTIVSLQNPDGTTLSSGGAGGGRQPLRIVKGGSRYLRTLQKRTGGAGTDRLAVQASLGN